MRLLAALCLLGLAAAGAGLGFVYSGRADVAATSPHWAVTEWLLSTTMERAVRHRAREIEPPGFLDDAARVRAGAVAYDGMCAPCHGAPGAEPGVMARGLEPKPPELVEEADDWSAAELFWITRNGVRMTGMPAFGPTHGDEELWEVVALVRRLPALSPAEYRALVQPAPPAAPEAPETPEQGHAGHEHVH